VSAPAVHVESSRESCTCERCVSLCRYVPGHFMPGELESAADLLGVPFGAFVRDYLTFSEICDTGVVGARPRYVQGTSRCVFLTPLGRCAIHAAKPFECRNAWCGDGPVDRADAGYHKVASEWARPEHQAQLVALRSAKRPSPHLLQSRRSSR
jgi:hypothetical protein